MIEFFFARPTFLGGVARVLDLGGSFDGYNSSLTEQIADARAVLSDWATVGKDLSGAMGVVAPERSDR